MKRHLILSIIAAQAVISTAAPISLHPDNPHYFLWRGKPTILITSGEHYGALLNLDFDYRKYLDTLAKDKLNNTRTWAGAYAETGGNFNIADNTLNPAAGRFICPWARSAVPGYADGGNKFDLTKWDEAYFKRLRDFIAYADKRGVVVEMNLFCPMYEDSMWSVCPMNASNNINSLGNIKRHEVLTLHRSGGLLAVQEAMVRRIVRELRDFDNVYYEVCNEPYAVNPRVPDDWQRHIAEEIADAQKDHRHRKLISLNIANASARITNPPPAVSVFNFHYAAPPDTVAMNWHLNKPIGDNETGFRGTNDTPYRTEAWDFIIAGGALFNHLDYSFTVGHEDGTFVYPETQPGGGNPTLRKQFRILRDFIYGFDFIRMKPDNSVIKGGIPPGGTARALIEPGEAYAIYLRQTAPTGPYSVRWTGLIEPQTTEAFTFHTFSNDGVRLWVFDQLIIDNWTDHGETENTGNIKLELGRRYPIKLEYFYNGGQGVAKLWWSGLWKKKEPVPANLLFLPEGGGQGLKGEYYQGNNFQRPWRTRTDAQVNFTFGTKPPFEGAQATGETALQLDLPTGRWKAEWVDTKTGRVAEKESFEHNGGVRTLTAPAYTDDIALRIRK